MKKKMKVVECNGCHASEWQDVYAIVPCMSCGSVSFRDGRSAELSCNSCNAVFRQDLNDIVSCPECGGETFVGLEYKTEGGMGTGDEIIKMVHDALQETLSEHVRAAGDLVETGGNNAQLNSIKTSMELKISIIKHFGKLATE